MEIITKNEKETKKIAQEILKEAFGEKRTLFFSLHGELGSGKTVFVKGVAEFLGIKEKVNSPTFVIEKNYKIDKLGFLNFVHIDAYRITLSSEIDFFHWQSKFQKRENIICVEWPENISSVIPPESTKIYFKVISEGERSIMYEL